MPVNERRSVKDLPGREPADISPRSLARRPSQAKRNRDWERRQREAGDLCTVTYRRIPVELRAAIRATADHVGVVADEVARALLSAGLELYNEGQLELDPIPTAGRRKGAWTLYPGERGPAE